MCYAKMKQTCFANLSKDQKGQDQVNFFLPYCLPPPSLATSRLASFLLRA